MNNLFKLKLILLSEVMNGKLYIRKDIVEELFEELEYQEKNKDGDYDRSL